MTAGKREEERNASLTVAFAIIVAAVRPTWFLMEDVVTAAKSSTYAPQTIGGNDLEIVVGGVREGAPAVAVAKGP